MVGGLVDGVRGAGAAGAEEALVAVVAAIGAGGKKVMQEEFHGAASS